MFYIVNNLRCPSRYPLVYIFLFYFRAFFLKEIVIELYIDGRPITKMDLIPTYIYEGDTLSFCSEAEKKEKRYSCVHLLSEQWFV